jgi:antirestriction protein ArdC
LFCRTYTIFNVRQCENVSADYVPETVDGDEIPLWQSEAAADAMVRRYVDGPDAPLVHEKRSDRAGYSPTEDIVTMPLRSWFPTAAGYYETLFHELGHSTGHGTRLARPGITNPVHFGNHEYSREELVAEMTSAFLCNRADIDMPELTANHAAYLASWIASLKGDPRMVLVAAQQAQKAAERIAGPVPVTTPATREPGADDGDEAVPHVA